MTRMTTDKKAKDMTMVELAYNSCYVKGYEAWYRDYEREISARDLAREVMLAQGLCEQDDIEMHDEDMLDETMFDNLAYPVKELEGLIAVFYRNTWAMADLYTRLKEYEDAEEQGLLLRLPCKVGDTIFEVSGGEIRELEVISTTAQIMRHDTNAVMICQNYRGACHLLRLDEIGKRAFLAREEAEAKLVELEATQ